MNTNNSFRQFVKDGLVGVVVALIIFGLLFSFLGLDLLKMAGVSVLGLLSSVLVIAFLGSGISGRFFENVSTRGDWIKSAFLTAFISWLIICVPISLLLLSDGWESAILLMPWVLIPTGFAAGIGFVSASLIGIVFNPITRVRRILIGAIESAITASGLSLMSIFIGGIGGG